MRIEEIGNVINSIETRFNVNEWELSSIKIWPFIRIQMMTLLNYDALNVPVLNTRTFNYGKKVLKAKYTKLCASLSDSTKDASIERADILLLSDGISFTKLDGVWYHKFCDPIYDYYLSKNIKCIRLDLSDSFCTPRYSPSKFIQPSIDNVIIRAIIANKLSMNRSHKNEIWGDFDVFLEDDYVNSKLNHIPDKGEIRAKIHKIFKLKKYFLKYLERIEPKIAFVVCYYSDTAMAFILACKELNIKTVDIQHGVQGDMHLAYGRWTNVPENGYPALPDYFWVWSSEEKKTIDRWSESISTHKAIVCKNSFAEFWKDNSNEIVKKIDEIIRDKRINSQNPSILITLSPGLSAVEYLKSTWEVVKSTQLMYNWYIRLHPAMIDDLELIREEISSFGIKAFDIDLSTSLPLYSLLRNVDLHITAQSSTVIEAADFNIISIITSKYGEELYENFIKMKQAFVCELPEEMEIMIKKIFLASRKENTISVQNSSDCFEIFNNIINNSHEKIDN